MIVVYYSKVTFVTFLQVTFSEAYVDEATVTAISIDMCLAWYMLLPVIAFC